MGDTRQCNPQHNGTCSCLHYRRHFFSRCCMAGLRQSSYAPVQPVSNWSIASATERGRKMSLIVNEINPIVRGPQQFRRRSSAYEKTAGRINCEGPFCLELARASASEGNIAGRIGAFGWTEPNVCQLSRTRGSKRLNRQHRKAGDCARDHSDEFAGPGTLQEAARRMITSGEIAAALISPLQAPISA